MEVLLADKVHKQELQCVAIRFTHATIPIAVAQQMPHYFTATYVGMVACVKRIATHCGSCLRTLSAINTFIPCM